MDILAVVMSYIWPEKSEINNVKKKPKKLYFTVFFDHLRAGRLTGFDTGLPVVSIRNTNRYTGFLLLKFKI
jgi:hypothetical protein